MAKLPAGANRNIIFRIPTARIVAIDGNAADMNENDYKMAVYESLGYYDMNAQREGFVYANDLRKTWDADWGFIVLLVDTYCHEQNHVDYDLRTHSSYYGPDEQLLWDLLGTDAGWLSSHESAHIFGAPDEYHNNGTHGPFGCGYLTDCDSIWSYLHERNRNCALCLGQHEPCLMRSSYSDWNWPICQWTPTHLGWRDSDSDQILDPMDHPESGGDALIARAGGDSLRIGDLLVIKTPEGGFIKTLPVTTRNSDRGVLAWDGMTYKGYRAANGEYRLYVDQEEVGTAVLGADVLAPELLDAFIFVNSGESYNFHLVIKFRDGDTGGCLIRAYWVRSGIFGQSMRVIQDEFFVETGDNQVIDRRFSVPPVAGNYEMHVLLWDVGGNHNVTRTIPFLAGPTAGASDRTARIPLSLSNAIPNPAAGLTRWELRGPAEDVVELSVVGIDGRRVRDLGRLHTSGLEAVLWDGRDDHQRQVGSGKYFLLATSRRGGRVIRSSMIVR